MIKMTNKEKIINQAMQADIQQLEDENKKLKKEIEVLRQSLTDVNNKYNELKAETVQPKELLQVMQVQNDILHAVITLFLERRRGITDDI